MRNELICKLSGYALVLIALSSVSSCNTATPDGDISLPGNTIIVGDDDRVQFTCGQTISRYTQKIASAGRYALFITPGDTSYDKGVWVRGVKGRCILRVNVEGPEIKILPYSPPVHTGMKSVEFEWFKQRVRDCSGLEDIPNFYAKDVRTCTESAEKELYEEVAYLFVMKTVAPVYLWRTMTLIDGTIVPD